MDLTGRLKRAREEQGAPMVLAPRARRVPAPAPLVLPACFQDAIQLVLSVKREFANEPGKYEEFRAIVSEYKSIGTPAVLDRVRVLLSGHPDPLRRFNMFFEGRGF
ncbi:unnamed protein product [Urochloa humidicola]